MWIVNYKLKFINHTKRSKYIYMSFFTKILLLNMVYLDLKKMQNKEHCSRLIKLKRTFLKNNLLLRNTWWQFNILDLAISQCSGWFLAYGVINSPLMRRSLHSIRKCGNASDCKELPRVPRSKQCNSKTGIQQRDSGRSGKRGEIQFLSLFPAYARADGRRR